MRLYFLKDFDGHKAGEHKFVELSLGRRYCEREIAIPYQQHLDEQYEKEQQEKERKAKELAAKKAAAKPKSQATAKKPRTRKKAVK